MTLVDPIGDMLTRIRNAQLRTLHKVKIPSSRFREKILIVLRDEGYIADYKILNEENNKNSLMVDLKYHNGVPIIKEIKRLIQANKVYWLKCDQNFYNIICKQFLQYRPKEIEQIIFNTPQFLRKHDSEEKFSIRWVGTVTTLTRLCSLTDLFF